MLDRRPRWTTILTVILAFGAPCFLAAEDKHLKLNISDEDVGAWMAINNAFTRIGNEDWPIRKKYWNGVLIQLGDLLSIAKPREPINIFRSVVFFKGKTKITEVTRKQFEDHEMWINIVAKGRARRDPPMTTYDLGRLKLVPPSKLHDQLIPLSGGITFWQDRGGGYTMTSATKDDITEPHTMFTFDIVSPIGFEITIYKNGHEVSLDLSGVDNIDITHCHDCGHGGHHNPPQR